jgi:hypothetical protein
LLTWIFKKRKFGRLVPWGERKRVLVAIKGGSWQPMQRTGQVPRNRSRSAECKPLEAVEELEDIRAYDEAKASKDEIIPFEQAIREIEQGRR